MPCLTLAARTSLHAASDGTGDDETDRSDRVWHVAFRWLRAEAVTPSLDAASRKLSWSEIAMKAVRSVRLPRSIPEFLSTLHAVNIGFLVLGIDASLPSPTE